MSRKKKPASATQFELEVHCNAFGHTEKGAHAWKYYATLHVDGRLVRYTGDDGTAFPATLQEAIKWGADRQADIERAA